MTILDASEISVDELGAADRTPLHRAAGANHVECCKTLISFGADLNKRDKTGRTPLHWAALQGNTAVVECLVENGADIFAINDKSYTSLHNSAEEGKDETVKLLLTKVEQESERHRLCNIENRNKKKAADLAKEGGYKTVLKALREGGDPNVKSGGCCIS